MSKSEANNKNIIQVLSETFGVGIILFIIAFVVIGSYMLLNPTTIICDNFRVAEVLDVQVSNVDFYKVAILYREEGKEGPTMAFMEKCYSIDNPESKIGHYTIIADYKETNKHGECIRTVKNQLYTNQLVLSTSKEEAELQLKDIKSKEEDTNE